MNEYVKEVSDLIKEVETTKRYSMSKIYGSYNKVFGTNEAPQSCASCLIRKVRELKIWLEAEKLKSDKEEIETLPIEGENKPKKKRKED